MKIKGCVKLKRCACGGKPVVNLGDEYYKGVYEVAVQCSKCSQIVGKHSLTEFIINSAEINKMFVGWNNWQNFLKAASKRAAQLDKEKKRYDNAIQNVEQQFCLYEDEIDAKSLQMSWMANNLTQKGLKKVLENMEKAEIYNKV